MVDSDPYAPKAPRIGSAQIDGSAPTLVADTTAHNIGCQSVGPVDSVSADVPILLGSVVLASVRVSWTAGERVLSTLVTGLSLNGG